MTSAFKFIATVAVLASVALAGLPECYIEPYAVALNATSCGPLDGQCICQSTTYLNALQKDIPQACDTADQVPIFSYIVAACSDFGANIALTTTTITSTLKVTQSAGATGAASTATTTCSSHGVSSGAIAGIAIATFIIGGLLFAAVAVLLVRKRQTEMRQKSVLATPYFGDVKYGSSSSDSYNKPLPMVETGTKRPRAELMPADDMDLHWLPTELS